MIKESLTEALFILMRKKPFEEITITEISKLAGVSRISFYRNFDSKEDLLVKYLFEKSMDEFSKYQAQSTQEKLIAMFKSIDHLHEVVDLLYQQNLSHLFYIIYAQSLVPSQSNQILKLMQNQ